MKGLRHRLYETFGMTDYKPKPVKRRRWGRSTPPSVSERITEALTDPSKPFLKFTAAEITSMSLAEYQKHRKTLLSWARDTYNTNIEVPK